MVTSSPMRQDRTVTSPRPELLASITDSHVLNAVRDAAEPISRAEIAKATGLSKPAVSTAVARLADRGVLHDVGIREGRRGGVATLFRINPDHGRSMAVVIQNDAVTVQSRDLDGVVRAEHLATVSAGSDSVRLVAQTNALIARVSDEHSTPLLTVAVSIADPVDARTSAPLVLERSVFPAALIRPREDLHLTADAEVVVDNDVNWAALGELSEGSLRGCSNFIYVYAGEGLGAGLILDGRLFRGVRGLAGEIGYLRVDGARDITQRLAELGLGTPSRYGLDPSTFSNLDAMLLDEIVEELAIAIANAVILVNPEAVALGGPLSLVPALADRLAQRIGALSLDPPRVVRSSTTPLTGAARDAHRRALVALGMEAVV
jgi:predicted NBD/HSP70 family sugar kinase